VLDTDRIEKEIFLCSQKLEEIIGNKVDILQYLMEKSGHFTLQSRKFKQNKNLLDDIIG